MQKRNTMRAALIPVITLVCVAANSVPVEDPATGNRYDLILVADITWDTAEADAASRISEGILGHLVTITKVEERNFVFRFLRGTAPGKLWIGGFQDEQCLAEPDGCWTWVNGEGDFVYADWGP